MHGGERGKRFSSGSPARHRIRYRRPGERRSREVRRARRQRLELIKKRLLKSGYTLGAPAQRAGEGLAVRRAARVESTEGRVSAHEIGVDLGSRASALGDGPDHERLPAPAVASGENPGTDVSNSPNSALKLLRWSTSRPSFSTKVCSGPRKPMARSTRSASHTFSLPSTSSEVHPAGGPVLDPPNANRLHPGDFARAIRLGG